MEREVPLYELLEGVPENARLVIDSEDGISTSFIPVGLYCKKAASALRQALAQPEQEPITKNMTLACPSYLHGYTAPPKREWVGLTDEEINLIYAQPQTHAGQYAKAIEAKLKEKNT